MALSADTRNRLSYALGSEVAGDEVSDLLDLVAVRIGTYTPVITLGTSGSVTTVGGQDGRWKRLGSTVIVYGRLQVDTITAPVGQLRVSLPFSVSSPSMGAVSIRPSNLAATAITALYGSPVAGQSFFTLSKYAAGATTDLGADLIVGTSLSYLCLYETDDP